MVRTRRIRDQISEEQGHDPCRGLQPNPKQPLGEGWVGTDLDMKDNWHHKYQNKRSSEWVSKRDQNPGKKNTGNEKQKA
jgi:hypothetical protein